MPKVIMKGILLCRNLHNPIIFTPRGEATESFIGNSGKLLGIRRGNNLTVGKILSDKVGSFYQSPTDFLLATILPPLTSPMREVSTADKQGNRALGEDFPQSVDGILRELF